MTPLFTSFTSYYLSECDAFDPGWPSRGRVGHLLTAGWELWFPATPIHMMKCLWARHWTPNCHQLAGEVRGSLVRSATFDVRERVSVWTCEWEAIVKHFGCCDDWLKCYITAAHLPCLMWFCYLKLKTCLDIFLYFQCYIGWVSFYFASWSNERYLGLIAKKIVVDPNTTLTSGIWWFKCTAKYAKPQVPYVL